MSARWESKKINNLNPSCSVRICLRQIRKICQLANIISRLTPLVNIWTGAWRKTIHKFLFAPLIQAVHVVAQIKQCKDRMSADDCTNDISYKCMWVGCKVFNMVSSSTTWLEKHVPTHGGKYAFACIVSGCKMRFSSQVRWIPGADNKFDISCSLTSWCLLIVPEKPSTTCQPTLWPIRQEWFLQAWKLRSLPSVVDEKEGRAGHQVRVIQEPSQGRSKVEVPQDRLFSTKPWLLWCRDYVQSQRHRTNNGDCSQREVWPRQRIHQVSGKCQCYEDCYWKRKGGSCPMDPYKLVSPILVFSFFLSANFEIQPYTQF